MNEKLSGVGGPVDAKDAVTLEYITGRDKHWHHRQLFRFLLKLGVVKPEHGIPGLKNTTGYTMNSGAQ